MNQPNISLQQSFLGNLLQTTVPSLCPGNYTAAVPHVAQVCKTYGESFLHVRPKSPKSDMDDLEAKFCVHCPGTHHALLKQ